ncbi:MAG: methylenetetrahydrofolate--tRNA-(uracil(54)-C(5))-methyltransferase (FADH(2)-oxidizing) TrmFO [Aestuariivita sp.]|nr:methylenetetrahydrofolate--tRNA-(uracil(54)-C(5))-methyltransferase (FADH(2)-oxidizing) TrmFO [Aestuariivita sp.]MCY4345886.1 methylenetetrahydrofolate--tRNA-(uracil(54)-C(5))-methyltransferase (FADH(2)-oxidizing) TrmFO [Aestuariivita sp.]
MNSAINVVGGGLAGSEAAWQAAQHGVCVNLFEMRPSVKTFAHQTDKLAELVCSNSFRSDDDETTAIGQLHWEIRMANGLTMAAADTHKLPAGSALAVDREKFAQQITACLKDHQQITVMNKEVKKLPDAGIWIIASGPATSAALARSIQLETNHAELAFYDAMAPIIYDDSIDMSIAWRQSRYDKGDTQEEQTAYINCPLDKKQYENFISALLDAEKTPQHGSSDTGYFDGCLPIEVMAERGRETLRYGPMKPVGLTNPHCPMQKPYAVVQLRRENLLGTLHNMVGFQTKMKHGAQVEVFRMIPGLQAAKFARLGGIHRNTFINSPKLLDDQLRLKSKSNTRFAGQVTGVEGYVESAAMGLVTGRMAAAEVKGKLIPPPPDTTATGALFKHITAGATVESFQPMNVNFGLFPPVAGCASGRRQRKARYKSYTDRAKVFWQEWLTTTAEILTP